MDFFFVIRNFLIKVICKVTIKHQMNEIGVEGSVFMHLDIMFFLWAFVPPPKSLEKSHYESCLKCCNVLCLSGRSQRDSEGKHQLLLTACQWKSGVITTPFGSVFIELFWFQIAGLKLQRSVLWPQISTLWDDGGDVRMVQQRKQQDPLVAFISNLGIAVVDSD